MSIATLHRNDGFTMIELLIAVAIMGISMVLVYGAHSAILSVIGHVDQTAAYQHRSGMVFDQFQRDFAGSYKGSSGFFKAEKHQDVERGKPFLQFTTSSQLRFDPLAPRVSTSIVNYYLIKSGDGMSLSMYRYEIPNVFGYSFGPDATSVPMMVCDKVIEVRMSFKDRYGSWLEQWQARSSGSGSTHDDGLFPTQIRIELVLADSSRPEPRQRQFTTTITVPVWQLSQRATNDEG